MLVWGVAVLLRVLGFGISWARLIVAVVVLLAAARGLLATGVLGLEWGAKSAPTPATALPIGAAAFGLLVALEVIDAAIPGAHPDSTASCAGGTGRPGSACPPSGLGVALSATAFMAIALG